MLQKNHPQLDLGKPVAEFTITTGVSKTSILSFPKFLTDSSGTGRFGPIAAGNFNHMAGEHGKFLIFDAKWYEKNYEATVRIKLDSPLLIEIFSKEGYNKDFMSRLEDYLILTLQAFEDAIRKETIFITFVPGIQETSKLSTRTKFSQKIFSGNMLNLILAAILFSFLIIFLISAFAPALIEYTPFIMIGFMLAIVLSAGKIVALSSNWRINEEHTDVVIVECKLDNTIIGSFMQTYGQSLSPLKMKIYDLMTSQRRAATSLEIANIFSEFGINVTPEQIIVKRVDVYGIVKRVAEKFEIPIPTIMITKNFRPNAAATGFTKHLATMMITIGLIIQLEEHEIELVVGHELSHLRFGDPVILFSIFSLEYLARMYVYYQYIVNFSILYLILVFWLVFFLGKFLEARADLEAAYILRDPQTMATSLKKIGFRRLALDVGFIEGKESTISEWFAFDPHPPIGYRIRRLEKLDLRMVPVGYVPKHTMLISISDVFGGIKAAMRR